MLTGVQCEDQAKRSVNVPQGCLVTTVTVELHPHKGKSIENSLGIRMHLTR